MVTAIDFEISCSDLHDGLELESVAAACAEENLSSRGKNDLALMFWKRAQRAWLRAAAIGSIDATQRIGKVRRAGMLRHHTKATATKTGTSAKQTA